MRITNIKYISIATFAFSSLLMGCNEEVYDGTYKPSLESKYISISPNEFSFDADGGSSIAHIYSYNNWQIQKLVHWLRTSESAGNGDSEIEISASENDESNDRIAIFNICSGNDNSISKNVIVHQKGSTAYVIFPNELNGTISISAPAQEILIPIETNVSIEDIVVSTTMKSDYGSYDLTSEGILLKATQNNNSIIRNYTFSIKANRDQRTTSTIKVLQEMPSMSTGTEIQNKEFDADGGTFSLEFSSDVDWETSISDSWIAINPERGKAGSHKLVISIAKNNSSDNRTGHIDFHDGQFRRLTLEIVQLGKSITLSESIVNLSSSGTPALDVKVISNTPWEIWEKPSWANIAPQNGESGETTVKISAETNESISTRTGNIFFKSVEGSVIAYLTCVQSGQEYGVDNNELLFNWNASSQLLNLTINAEWRCATSDSWISISQYSGAGDVSLTVNVEKNTGTQTRTGYIVITSEGDPITIPVIQYGQFFYIDSTFGNIGAMGGEILLSVSSSIGSDARISYSDNVESESWLSYSKQNDSDYILNATYNNSIYSRQAEFIIEPTDDDINDEYRQGIIFSVIQLGRQLSSNVSEIELSLLGGYSETYEILADGNYDIYKDPNDNWYTLSYSKETNTFSLFATENMTGSIRKGTITMSLSGLPPETSKQIEIIVLQTNKTSFDPSVNVENYGQDKNWNL